MQFTKMHGLGNDFIVIDATKNPFALSPEQINRYANRNTGIGFDQCLVIEPSMNDRVDFYYRIFNANGEEVGQCGNGARCLALYLKRNGLIDKQEIRVATKTTEMLLYIQDDNLVTVSLDKPKFKPKSIPLNVNQELSSYLLELENEKTMKIHAVNVGNPHAVLVVEDITKVSVNELGMKISQHYLFPEQSNVGFVQICSPHHIKLRVYERGCGETRACGSGAVAAAVIIRKFYDIKNPVTVSLPGGDLIVSWELDSDEILLTGPATFVYEGTTID